MDLVFSFWIKLVMLMPVGQRYISFLAKSVTPSSTLATLWDLKWGSDSYQRVSAFWSLVGSVSFSPNPLRSHLGEIVLYNNDLIQEFPNLSKNVRIEILMNVLCGPDLEKYEDALEVLLNLEYPLNAQKIVSRHQFLFSLAEKIEAVNPRSKGLARLRDLSEEERKIESAEALRIIAMLADTDPDMDLI